MVGVEMVGREAIIIAAVAKRREVNLTVHVESALPWTTTHQLWVGP